MFCIHKFHLKFQRSWLNLNETCVLYTQVSFKISMSQWMVISIYYLNETCVLYAQVSFTISIYYLYTSFIYNFSTQYLYGHGTSKWEFKFFSILSFQKTNSNESCFLETQVSFNIFGKVMVVLVSGQLERLVILCF